MFEWLDSKVNTHLCIPATLFSVPVLCKLYFFHVIIQMLQFYLVYLAK